MTCGAMDILQETPVYKAITELKCMKIGVERFPNVSTERFRSQMSCSLSLLVLCLSSETTNSHH